MLHHVRKTQASRQIHQGGQAALDVCTVSGERRRALKRDGLPRTADEIGHSQERSNRRKQVLKREREELAVARAHHEQQRYHALLAQYLPDQVPRLSSHFETPSHTTLNSQSQGAGIGVFAASTPSSGKPEVAAQVSKQYQQQVESLFSAMAGDASKKRSGVKQSK